MRLDVSEDRFVSELKAWRMLSAKADLGVANVGKSAEEASLLAVCEETLSGYPGKLVFSLRCL